MHLKTFRIRNFRRLKDVRVDLDPETSIFVGANNSGKTSATHIFQLFLGASKGNFSVYDFTADCWTVFDGVGNDGQDPADLPTIDFDLWFDVDDENVHRVIDLLPDLEWDKVPVGVRLTYAPRDGEQLIKNYLEARAKGAAKGGKESSAYESWPQNLTDYLTRRLRSEYEIKYYVLDAAHVDTDLRLEEGYEPFPLGGNAGSAARIVDSLIRVDFLDAQRHLSDGESRGRYEDLSKRLSRFYARNLQQQDDDLEALRAIADSEARLNSHFADVFSPIIDSLSQLGYPGVGNHGLVVKASFNATSLLSGSARVHYTLPRQGADGETTDGPMLPDQYNGLGFKNLIYMVVEMLDFHHAWTATDEDRPPVHLVMIEEPEAHLHAQLQQVFIRKILDILPSPGVGFETQLVVTTHSSHILYERNFQAIRYFRRAVDQGPFHCSEVRNLSVFYDNEEATTRNFLLQYLKLTHCDLFFADAAVLVEGNVERLLLPLIIQKSCPELRACHLTILEVGGAFAHKFSQLIDFLQLPTLVITDLDSVMASGAPTIDEDDEDDEDGKDDTDGPGESTRSKACRSDTLGAVTSNQTLRQWIPQLETVSDLLAAAPAQKVSAAGLVGVAYQTKQPVEWGGLTEEAAGRTLEEAFALQNLAWCQDAAQKELGLRIRGSASLDLDTMKQRVFSKVRSLDKTKFALGLIAAQSADWSTPVYISEGLEWLRDTLQVRVDMITPEVTHD
jgi:predicted ATP-dependent endonuclease of OLD family